MSFSLFSRLNFSEGGKNGNGGYDTPRLFGPEGYPVSSPENRTRERERRFLSSLPEAGGSVGEEEVRRGDEEISQRRELESRRARDGPGHDSAAGAVDGLAELKDPGIRAGGDD